MSKQSLRWDPSSLLRPRFQPVLFGTTSPTPPAHPTATSPPRHHPVPLTLASYSHPPTSPITSQSLSPFEISPMETSTRPPDDPSAAAEADAMFATRGCCCFWVPWSSDRRSWEPVRPPPPPETGGWWRRGIEVLMKVREWSEMVAGPRWKTFIRRFNRNPRLGGGTGRRWTKYQYDPLSYALNFDEGRGQEESPGKEAGAGGFRDFSSRYAGTPGTSMDLGGRDEPSIAAAVGH